MLDRPRLSPRHVPHSVESIFLSEVVQLLDSLRRVHSTRVERS